MSTEEKFRAAVNVIRSLPKNGSYQPSYDLQLKFYSYFKQGSEGPCTESQPAFWEVVKRKKWEAWKKLGNMPKQQAMESYVEELKKIVETMSYNENVEEFLGSLGSFYEAVPQEDLHMAVGDIIERVSSRGSSPAHSTASPTRQLNLSLAVAEEDDDEEEFKDSVAKQDEEEVVMQRAAAKKNGHAIQPAENATQLATRISMSNHKNLDLQVADQLRDTIRQMQKDFDRLGTRVKRLEETSGQKQQDAPARRGIWPLQDVSPRTAAIIVLWPLVVHAAVAVWRSRRRQ